MLIEKADSREDLERFIEREQDAYEAKSGVSCNFTPFCFSAKEDGEIVGALTGFTCFSEVYIDDLVVKEDRRKSGIGTRLVRFVENHYKGKGFNNINLCTNEFQAPGFYEKLGFELEFVRKNSADPKLNKYFYVKFF